ncbi:hypothetical protein L7F22_024197 [Adiantum nelumboides]|nr:hypothetical protein [Adiantum nelumboides]
MQLGKRISLIKQCHARSAIAVFWRQHSAVAAANEGKKKELEFELDEHLNSEAPSRQFESFFRTKEPQRRASFTAFESPVERFWKGGPRISDTSPREKFTIISFNILATELAYKHRSMYSSLSRAQLYWTIRKRKIIHGLAKYAPDIICLQEVDKFEDLEETLASKGYIGLYKTCLGGRVGVRVTYTLG